MGQVLVAGAIIQCSHKGQVKLSGGDARLSVSGNGAITFGMEVGLSFAPGSPGLIAPCTNVDKTKGPPPPLSPCAATLPATSGLATLLAVGGIPVLLDDAKGQATNQGDPLATWSVASAGQNLLSTS
jgi:hypothetical protein